MTKTEWETESVRITLLGGIEPAMTFSWSSITGQQPDTVTNRPSQGIQVEEGMWGGGQLVLSCQPGRMEFILSALPGDPSLSANLGDFRAVLDRFEPIFAKRHFPKVLRIAIGAKLNKFVDNEKEATAFIGQLFPDFKPSANYSDLTIQYNDQKKFPKIGGLVLNRIVKCSQLVMHTVQYLSNQQLENQQRPLVQVELDYNTSPASSLPHPDSYSVILKAIFGELRAYAGVEL